MKKVFTNLAVVSMVIGMTACGGGVTMADVKKQEDKAMDELLSAQEEMLELASMKEQYSEDHRDAEIKEMKKRMKAMDSDIKKLEGVKSSSAEGAAGNIAGGLKDDKKKLEQQIKKMESQPKENWAEAKEAINQQVKQLEQRVNSITASLENAESDE